MLNVLTWIPQMLKQKSELVRTWGDVFTNVQPCGCLKNKTKEQQSNEIAPGCVGDASPSGLDVASLKTGACVVVGDSALFTRSSV